MVKKSILRCQVLIFSLIIIIGQIPISSVSAGSGDQISFTLELPVYEIQPGEDGFDRIQVEGYGFSGIVGEPRLPLKSFTFALPPDADFNSLDLEIISVKSKILPGTFNIPSVSPPLPMDGLVDSLSSLDPGEPQASSHDWVELLPPGQFRQWKAARVVYHPFKYDPETGELSVASEVTFQISYQTSAQGTLPSLNADPRTNRKAKEIFTNYQAARGWYETDQGLDEPNMAPSSDPTYDLVIIGSKHFIPDSTVFDTFVSHKEDLGYSTLYIDEDDFVPLTGQSPNGYAEKIRQWLIDHYLVYNIQYVLIIGDPEPEETPGVVTIGDIPMKMTWPRNNNTTHYPQYDRSPTDYFYADLTGDWDKDGDEYFGEFDDDYQDVTGGVDLIPEVYVGRIPVYDRNYGELDLILQKIIDYETELSIVWRTHALLPMSFLASSYDDAMFAEQLQDDILLPETYSSFTMYQQGNGACGPDSTYSSDAELRGGTGVRDQWAATDYGFVAWSGHGSPTTTMVGYDGCDDGNLMAYSYASALDDDHPSFVFQGSCLNGYPESNNNLGFALLRHGAIGTVSASRVSWFNAGAVYGDYDGSSSIQGVAYEFSERLIADKLSAGKALYDAKASLTASSDSSLMNFFDFNLYGDPTTRVNSQGEPTIVINEVNTGAYNSVELYNNGSSAVSLGDFTFTGYTSWASTFTLPPFTLAPGNFVILDERPRPVGFVPSTIFFDQDLPWEMNQSGAAVLTDNQGVGIDFVRWGDSLTPPLLGTNWSGDNPPVIPSVDQTLGRHPDGSDSDHGSDWCLQVESLLAANTGCLTNEDHDSIGMYSRGQKTWYLKDANDDGWSNVTTVRFGSTDSSWIPVVGDWNGNGTDTIGMYSRGQKTWYLKDANIDGWGGVTTVRFGSTDSSWIPVAGDWNGDGTDTVGMYSRNQKTWYLKAANVDGWGGVTTVRFGSTDSSWIPVAGDWNGDGTDTIGMYSRTQKTWYLKGANIDGWGGVTTIRFGSVDGSWIPAVGDWNGNGTDKIGMYSRTQKTWYLKDANDDGWSNVSTVRFGSTDTSWLPVTGEW